MLYKHLFFVISYFVKKYDKFWNVGETYYVGGGMIVGITIAATLINLLNIIGGIFFHKILWLEFRILIYLPLFLGIITTIYLGRKGRHLKFYEEVQNLKQSEKKKYGILNIYHVFIVYLIFTNIKPLLIFFNLINNY
jgi:hypothetical protein